ncbi:sialate O-acetylesterase [Beijerinckia indica]|uniref:sialate O-acetylesterase n=1 Tax=Beijerinckia indica TaxID=533 RepID=UPI0013054243|nr:sialate O-acetylesterase [Beijerinckia indica]
MSKTKSPAAPRRGMNRLALTFALLTALYPSTRGFSDSAHPPSPTNRRPAGSFQTPRPCRLDSNSVILVIGQSNGANFAYSYSKAQDPDAAAFYNGRCYALSDPLPGGDGGRGSQWPAFADLFRAKFGRSVTLISAGWGGTSVRDWSENGFDAYALSQAKLVLDAKGKIDAIFWQQGESDPNTDAETYAARLQVVLDRFHALAPNAPIFIAQATLQNGRTHEAVREVQRRFAAKPGMAPGPDADKITDRYDGLHFGAQGTRELTQAWFDAVVACTCLKAKGLQ